MISKEETKRKGIAIPFTKDVLATEMEKTLKLTPFRRRKVTPFRRRKLTPQNRCKLTPFHRRKMTPIGSA